ncbi:hypothetical protein K438DRAFT_1761222 [Mycena galopus ATCC 62051]|nr:hypothetical protein K438DRAFT_1761222 [Mycena galopus ATCC 62051]
MALHDRGPAAASGLDQRAASGDNRIGIWRRYHNCGTDPRAGFRRSTHGLRLGRSCAEKNTSGEQRIRRRSRDKIVVTGGSAKSKEGVEADTIRVRAVHQVGREEKRSGRGSGAPSTEKTGTAGTHRGEWMTARARGHVRETAQGRKATATEKRMGARRGMEKKGTRARDTR